MPSSFVEWQHAQVATPHRVLAELVERAVGAPIEQVDRIVEGYENEVYRIRCADVEDLVVRILRFGRFAGDFTRSKGEAHAISQARAAGVPAPEILLLDTVRLDGSNFPVMVQRAVPGRPLAEVIGDLSEPQRHDVLVEIGGLIARLNQVPIPNDRDWQATVAATIADRRREREQIRAGGFSAAQFDQMIALLEGYARDFPCERWVLCHGDISARHVFVTGDGRDGEGVRVSGIIDWGDRIAGAPVHDLAVFRVRSPQLDLAPVLAGYGAPAGDTYRRRLDLATLPMAMSSLWIAVDEDDQPLIERSRELIRTLLAGLNAPGFELFE